MAGLQLANAAIAGVERAAPDDGGLRRRAAQLAVSRDADIRRRAMRGGGRRSQAREE